MAGNKNKSSNKSITEFDNNDFVVEASKSKIDKGIEFEKIDKGKKDNSNKSYKHPFIDFFLFITIIFSIIYFIVNIGEKDASIINIINSSILCLFSVIYLGVCLTYRRKNKNGVLFSSIILLIYFLLNINNSVKLVKTPVGEVVNLSGKSITQAIKWADKNSIKVTQEYEFSDLIPEYNVIGQSVKAGTNLDGVKEMTIVISEGPNPYKEVVVPSMITWDSERVINFIKKNYLTNVEVEFVESDKVKDTVIEQSKSGNLLRNDELKLTFSYGDSGNSDKASVIDFTNMSKFEIEFFMKQHHLNYEFKYEFSSKIKKGYGVSQDVKAKEEVEVDGKSITVTISKGPEIKVPKLDNMDINEITDWAVKNKLKLEFVDRYDEKVKLGKVISIDKEVGSVIEQGTTIKVMLSLGSLKMPNIDVLDDFYSWADRYEIKYEVKHEYSDSVEAGKVIKTSKKKGQALKNDEVIIITVSDGVKRSVPNVVGLTKSQASSKLSDAGLKSNFIYKNSTTEKDKVLSQSIGSGTEVPDGTTITVTLSNGKAPSSNNNSGGSTSTPKPTCDTSKGANVWFMAGSTGADTYSMTKNQNPGFTITVNYVDSCPNGNTSSGTLCSKSVGDGEWVSYCTTITMTVVK